jgi:hypothetical protein|tara:strand:+ start:349 stop:522 length:174 start_codon:yes stop_codon:yes gene_type:complete
MDITSAQYIKGINGTNSSVRAEIDGEKLSVPLDPDNRHYAAILEWAEEDGNEIQAAE